MSNEVNIFDLENETLAQFLARTADDGTFAHVFNAVKVDKTGKEVPATNIYKAAGQLWANGFDDYLKVTYPLMRAVALGQAIPDATTSVKGKVQLATNGGTGATDAVTGSDSRLSDARAPTAHAATHGPLGGDALKLDDLAAPDDNTDLNATTGAHGLLPKLPGDSTFLRGDGSWAAPPNVPPSPLISLDIGAGIPFNAEFGITSAGWPCLVFGSMTSTACQWVKSVPSTYDGGALTLRMRWSGTVSSTDNVGLSFELIRAMTGVNLSDEGDSPEVNTFDVPGPATAEVVKESTWELTNEELGTISAGDTLIIRVTRSALTDPYSGDVQVFGLDLV